MLSAKLSKDSLQFISINNTNMNKDSRVIAFSAARALSYLVQVSPTPVNDLRDYYNTTDRLKIEALVSSINEIMVINTELTLEYFFKLYNFKYQSAHSNVPPVSFNAESSIEQLFGISRHFDTETIKMMKEKSSDISINTSGFIKIISDLKGQS